jgi:hypothetical protein
MVMPINSSLDLPLTSILVCVAFMSDAQKQMERNVRPALVPEVRRHHMTRRA